MPIIINDCLCGLMPVVYMRDDAWVIGCNRPECDFSVRDAKSFTDARIKWNRRNPPLSMRTMEDKNADND